MHHSRALSTGTGFHRQHRPAVALSNHGVLEMGGPTPDHVLQPVPASGPQLLPLPSQTIKPRAGSVSNPSPLFNGEFQALLEIGEGRHIPEECCAHRAQLRFIDLATQATGSGQGVGHI